METEGACMPQRHIVAAILLALWACCLGLLLVAVFGAWRFPFDLASIVIALVTLPLLSMLFTLARCDAVPRVSAWLLLAGSGAQLVVLVPLVLLILRQHQGWRLSLLTYSMLVCAIAIVGMIGCAVVLGLLADSVRRMPLVSAIAFLPLVLATSYAVVAMSSFVPLHNAPTFQAVDAQFEASMVIALVVSSMVALLAIVASFRRTAAAAAVGAVALVQLVTLTALTGYSLLLLALREGT